MNAVIQISSLLRNETECLKSVRGIFWAYKLERNPERAGKTTFTENNYFNFLVYFGTKFNTWKYCYSADIAEVASKAG